MKVNIKIFIILFFGLTTSIFYAQVNYKSYNPDLNGIDPNKIVDLASKIFTDSLVFKYDHFKKEFEISLSKFSNSSFVTFHNARFDSKVTFKNLIFNSDVDFAYAEFETIVIFKESVFNNTAKFTNAVFKDHANFSEVEFNEFTDFSNVEFSSKVSFNKVKFNNEIDFTNVTLPDYIDFEDAILYNEIDLTDSKIKDGSSLCNINLVGATISNIRFRYKRFNLWFAKDCNYELKANVYEVLLNKQSTEGFTDSYKKLDKEYKAFKYTDKGYRHGKWGVFQNWVDKHWWGYGYNKELIVLNSILLYLIFSFFNTFFLKHLTNKIYKSDKINEYWQETKSEKLILFIKSVPFSLFYTAQIFFGYKFDMDKLNYKENLQGWKIFNLLYFFVIYLSGLVCLAYLMNYVLTV